MKSPVVVIGIGEMGSVFARAFLRNGYPVYPVTRSENLAEAAREIPVPELVLIAVGEKGLHSVLESIPPAWFNRLALLQNELLPDDWQRYGFPQPTIISVWFEKKKGQDVKILIPSPVFGPSADLLVDSLGKLDIPAHAVKDAEALLFELVIKNVYIVTTNCAGLVTGGTVNELWSNHRELAEQVAREVIQIQETLVDQSLPADELIKGMLTAFEGDPDHGCMGRSAPARLTRALHQANKKSLDVPALRDIAQQQN